MCALWHTTLWMAAICKLAKPYLFKKIGHYYPVIINVSLLSHFWLPLLRLWNNQHHNYFYDIQVIELSLTWHHPFGFDLISLLSWLWIRVLVFSYRLFPVYGLFHTSQQCVPSCFQERKRACSLEKSRPNLLLHTRRRLSGLTFGASPHYFSPPPLQHIWTLQLPIKKAPWWVRRTPSTCILMQGKKQANSCFCNGKMKNNGHWIVNKR